MTNNNLEGIKQRIDKWLWCARFFKTRTLATKIVLSGKVEIDGKKVTKSHALLYVGSRISFVQGKWIRDVKVISFSETRGPAKVAAELYEDFSLKAPKLEKNKVTLKYNKWLGSGRPTKKNRRLTDKIKKLNSLDFGDN